MNRCRARAREALSAHLAELDPRHWQLERDVQLAGVTIPFVAFGPSGVFVLTASPAWAMGDLTVLQAAAEDLGASLPGYPDPVRAAVYLPFDGGETRWWWNASGASAWIVGAGGLEGFLAHFADRGFSTSDLHALGAGVAASVSAAGSLARLPRRAARG